MVNKTTTNPTGTAHTAATTVAREATEAATEEVSEADEAVTTTSGKTPKITQQTLLKSAVLNLKRNPFWPKFVIYVLKFPEWPELKQHKEKPLRMKPRSGNKPKRNPGQIFLKKQEGYATRNGFRIRTRNSIRFRQKPNLGRKGMEEF